ncbi:MAG: hypothetical protein V4488_21500 [Pseudomonadota bacterium]
MSRDWRVFAETTCLLAILWCPVLRVALLLYQDYAEQLRNAHGMSRHVVTCASHSSALPFPLQSPSAPDAGVYEAVITI